MINNIIDCMVKHRSIRSYTDKAVSEEDLNSHHTSGAGRS